MKLLVDVGVGLLCEQWLRSADHDLVAIREFDPAMPDLDILALAVKEQRLVIPARRSRNQMRRGF